MIALLFVAPAQATAVLGAESDLIAVYDQRRWWVAPQDALTTARFDPLEFENGPGDESLIFETLFPGPAQPVSQGPSDSDYLEFLAREDLGLDRLPLEGTLYVLQGNSGYHLRERGYGDFAWDLVRADENRVRFVGSGAENDDYFVWDDPVYLPLGGYVAEVVRDAPDNPPGRILGVQSNLVGIRVAGRYYLYLLHLRQGSVPADFEIGDFLPAGTYIGRVGNSGVTLEPHLHLTLQWLDRAAGRLWSVPTVFEDLWISGDGRRFEPTELSRPVTGVWISVSPDATPLVEDGR